MLQNFTALKYLYKCNNSYFSFMDMSIKYFSKLSLKRVLSQWVPLAGVFCTSSYETVKQLHMEVSSWAQLTRAPDTVLWCPFLSTPRPRSPGVVPGRWLSVAGSTRQPCSRRTQDSSEGWLPNGPAQISYNYYSLRLFYPSFFLASLIHCGQTSSDSSHRCCCPSLISRMAGPVFPSAPQKAQTNIYCIIRSIYDHNVTRNWHEQA